MVKTVPMSSGGSTPTVKKSLGRTASAVATQISTKQMSKNSPTLPSSAWSITTVVRASASPSATT